MQVITVTNDAPPQTGNAADASYADFLKRVDARFAANTSKAHVFTTDTPDLWDVYLGSFPATSRQYHNCNACRRFVERVGGLVTIGENGTTAPAAWHMSDADNDHASAVEAITARLRRAIVTGVFLSSEPTLGQHFTPSRKGDWVHLSVSPTPDHVFRNLVQTAGQAMAEKLEDFKNVQRALEEFAPPVLAQALSLLNSDALYRSEKVLGPAKWLADLHTAIATHKGRRANIVWRAIASAPAGFCHPRSSMIGTLLEDIAAGMPFEEVARRFKDKMHPLQYQRPQAAPSAGNIAQAEKVIEKLKAAGSLERRFARLGEVDALWRPAVPETPKAGGVFSHLKPKEGTTLPLMAVPSQAITWEKFRRTVLAGAKTIAVLVPHAGNFTAIVTAANSEAPPILQWDSSEKRNPFSWYLYNGGSIAASWGLVANVWSPVTAITLRPPSWFGGTFTHQGEGAVIVIDGAKDSRAKTAGAGLFPEIMRAEFHGIRATIEAYSRGARIAGEDDASACGLMLQKGSNDVVHVRVTDGNGVRLEYRIDRWD